MRNSKLKSPLTIQASSSISTSSSSWDDCRRAHGNNLPPASAKFTHIGASPRYHAQSKLSPLSAAATARWRTITLSGSRKDQPRGALAASSPPEWVGTNAFSMLSARCLSGGIDEYMTCRRKPSPADRPVHALHFNSGRYPARRSSSASDPAVIPTLSLRSRSDGLAVFASGTELTLENAAALITRR